MEVREHRSAYGTGDGLEQYHSRVRHFLEVLSGDCQLAEDLAQETYLRAYAHLERHARTIGKPREWLFTIARCVYVDYVRYRAVRPEVNLESLDGLALAREEPCSEAIDVREEIARLSRAIDELGACNRALVVGFHIEGEQLRDLAARHGLSPGTARVRLFRIRRALQRRLA